MQQLEHCAHCRLCRSRRSSVHSVDHPATYADQQLHSARVLLLLACSALCAERCRQQGCDVAMPPDQLWHLGWGQGVWHEQRACSWCHWGICLATLYHSTGQPFTLCLLHIPDLQQEHMPTLLSSYLFMLTLSCLMRTCDCFPVCLCFLSSACRGCTARGLWTTTGCCKCA